MDEVGLGLDLRFGLEFDFGVRVTPTSTSHPETCLHSGQKNLKHLIYWCTQEGNLRRKQLSSMQLCRMQ